MAQRAGKVVLKWKYYPPGAETKDMLEIPLRLEDKSGDKYVDLTYHVYLDNPITFYDSNKDVEVLKKKVWEALNNHFDITWENFFLVKTHLDSGHNHFGDSAQRKILEISFERIQVGTRRDGLKSYRDPGRTGRSWVTAGTPETGIKRNDLHQYGSELDSSALIPDTPENETALQAIHKAMGELGERVALMLSPEKIQASLAMSQPLLAPPKETSNEEEKTDHPKAARKARRSQGVEETPG